MRDRQNAPAAGRMNEKAISFVFIADNVGLKHPVRSGSSHKGKRYL
jgi:hypothetical protein